MRAARAACGRHAWQKTAAETLIDDFYALQGELAARVLESA